MSLIAANVFAVMKNEKKVIVIINTKTAVVFFFSIKIFIRKIKMRDSYSQTNTQFDSKKKLKF